MVGRVGGRGFDGGGGGVSGNGLGLGLIVFVVGCYSVVVGIVVFII